MLRTYYKAGAAVAGIGDRAEKSEAKLLFSSRLRSSTVNCRVGWEGTGWVEGNIAKLLFAFFNLILVRFVFHVFSGVCNITISKVGIYFINNKTNPHILEVYAPNIFLINFDHFSDHNSLRNTLLRVCVCVSNRQVNEQMISF